MKLMDYCSGYTYDTFTADIKLVEACVFNLGQLGELCRIVDDAFAAAHPEIPWREMYGLRNRIVHDYEGVNLRLVWEIISEDIPALKDTLEKLKVYSTSDPNGRGRLKGNYSDEHDNRKRSHDRRG